MYKHRYFKIMEENKPIYYNSNFTLEDFKKACAELEKNSQQCSPQSVMDLLWATYPTLSFMQRLDKACEDYIESLKIKK